MLHNFPQDTDERRKEFARSYVLSIEVRKRDNVEKSHEGRMCGLTGIRRQRLSYFSVSIKFLPLFLVYGIISTCTKQRLSNARSLMWLSLKPFRWGGLGDKAKISRISHSRQPPFTCPSFFHVVIDRNWPGFITITPPSLPAASFFFFFFTIPAKRLAEPICSNRQSSTQREGLCCPVGRDFKGGSGVKELRLRATTKLGL